MPCLASFLPSIRRQFRAARTYSVALASSDGLLSPEGQLEKLKAVWSDCVSDIPYYRNIVATGKAPREIQSWDDFQALPELDRSKLKENFAAFVRDSGPPEEIVSTAGSTGQPVKLGVWKHEGDPLRIAKMVPWLRHGYTPEKPLYLIWGHAHLLGTGWRRYVRHAVRGIKDLALGYHRVDAYSMGHAKCCKIAEEIIALRPAGVIGYAAVLDLIVRSTEDMHGALTNAGVGFVLSCAEPPPRWDSLPLLRKVFGCPVLQEFGGVDFGHVAFKVGADPFRVFPDLNLLETVDDPGEPDGAAALVTTLYPRYTPLVRYRQGDLLRGARKDGNGHVFEFDELYGRINDIITLPAGVKVHSVALAHCVKDEDSVFNAQLALTDAGPVLRLVVKGSLAVDAERRIRHRLGQVHASLSSLPFELAHDLRSNRAGKRRSFLDERTGGGAET
jgi:phenylacetate-CoA ligase